MVYELNYKKPVIYVIPIESILGKLPVVPLGDTGTIPRGAQGFPNEFGDSSARPGDGCRGWYVNCWALGWSCEM